MLVPWGVFAQRIGLVRALEEVPIPQRRREHTPQTKLIEFLVSILAGCAYLQDISHGPHPLDQDVATAQAWGRENWADYSGVSRTLRACTQETATAVKEALEAVSRPFIEREVMLALRDRGVLIYDGDLTGRPVSNSSTTYPEAAFGWMGDAVHFGYQAAMVSMHSPTYGRLWLSVEQHPGDTVSSSQAEAMVRAAEGCTRARPWRRTDLLTQRMERHRRELKEAATRYTRAQARLEEAQQRLAQVEQERQMWAQQVAELAAAYQARNRPERPYSRLAQARHKLAVRERRLTRRQQDLERARRWLERCQKKVAALQAELEQLQQRLTRFIEDNRTNPWPIRAIFRLDGGFGSGDNVALLIEMGYEVYSKAKNHQVVQALRRRVTATTSWTRVGKNAEMVAWEGEEIGSCPYPLDVALERFHTGHEQRHSVLLHYGTQPVTNDLEGWFTFYNGRQLIEAGIKEGKQVFQMHHLKVRSPAGLVIQELFAAFAANFVRWAAAWLHEICPDAPTPFDAARPSVKEMVRIAANTSAWVIWQPAGCL
jgi:exonuclease VII small subunit